MAKNNTKAKTKVAQKTKNILPIVKERGCPAKLVVRPQNLPMVVSGSALADWSPAKMWQKVSTPRGMLVLGFLLGVVAMSLLISLAAIAVVRGGQL